jgi:hypothetical protein
MHAVSGAQEGARLEWIPAHQMTWSAWKEMFPASEVLSEGARGRRAYTTDPYAGYHRQPGVMFPVPVVRTELPLKAWVLGVQAGGTSKAYSLSVLEKKPVLSDRIGGVAVEVRYEAEKRLAVVTELDSGRVIPSVQVYWFAWQAFYPDSELVFK